MARVTSATESTGVCTAKKTASSNIPASLLPMLVFDERPQALGRVVPLRRDLVDVPLGSLQAFAVQVPDPLTPPAGRSEEHTSELQSHSDLVCRLLLEKKNKLPRQEELAPREAGHSEAHE